MESAAILKVDLYIKIQELWKRDPYWIQVAMVMTPIVRMKRPHDYGNRKLNLTTV